MDWKTSFDLDLSSGKEGEDTVANLLQAKTIEVKTDFICVNTGNVAVEYRHKGNPSGISTSCATHWAFVIPEKCTVIVETTRLRVLCKEWHRRRSIKKGGDRNQSSLIMIPIKELMNG